MIGRDVDRAIRVAFVNRTLRCLLVHPCLHWLGRSARGGEQGIARTLLHRAHLIPQVGHLVIVHAEIGQLLPHGRSPLRQILIDLRQHCLQREQKRSGIVLTYLRVIGGLGLLRLSLRATHNALGTATALHVADRTH